MKKWFSVLILVLGLVSQATLVSGDDWPPPRAFEVYSADGRYVFRFEPTDDVFEVGSMAVFNVETDELIYTVGWYEFPGNPWLIFENMFRFSDDLRYFNFIPVSQTVAILFYENGRLINSHNIYDLVGDHRLISYSVSTAFWQNATPIKIDDLNNTLTLETIDNITYVFDMRSGEILSYTGESNSENSTKYFALIALTGVLLLGTGYVVVIKRRGKTENGKTRNS